MRRSSGGADAENRASGRNFYLSQRPQGTQSFDLNSNSGISAALESEANPAFGGTGVRENIIVQDMVRKQGTGIVFSSGFFGFFAHAGFLSAIRELGIKPAGVSGSSSGAILAAMAATEMTDDAIRETVSYTHLTLPTILLV